MENRTPSLNRTTIGIELENNYDSGGFTSETENAAIQLTAEIMLKNGLDPQKDLYRHNDLTGKNCPKYYVDNPGEWEQFKYKVEQEMERLGGV